MLHLICLSHIQERHLFKRLETEGRILTYDWSKYNGRRDVVFKPKNMTCEELLEGFNWVNNQLLFSEKYWKKA